MQCGQGASRLFPVPSIVQPLKVCPILLQLLKLGGNLALDWNRIRRVGNFSMSSAIITDFRTRIVPSRIGDNGIAVTNRRFVSCANSDHYQDFWSKSFN